MISDVLQSIRGIEIFPIIALLLSMLVFLLMLFRVFRLGRAEVERIKRLPLDADSERRTVLEDCDGAGGR